MNISLPKTKHRVSALFKIGIAGSIPFSIGLLDWVKFEIQRGVGMPEITVPLNDNSELRQQDVHNEFSTNDLLLSEGNVKRFKDRASRRFKSVRIPVGGKSQCAIDTLHVSAIVATGMATVLNRIAESPPRNIERLAASDTLLYDAAASCVYGIAAGLLFGDGCFLPSIRASDGTECNRATAAGDKFIAAMTTSIRTTFVTATGEVGAGQKWPPAFFTNFWMVSDVPHTHIIPWMVARCNLN